MKFGDKVTFYSDRIKVDWAGYLPKNPIKCIVLECSEHGVEIIPEMTNPWHNRLFILKCNFTAIEPGWEEDNLIGHETIEKGSN